MAINLEEQSLATLKEWANLLGIRGVSAARKGEMVELLSRVGEEKIQYVLEKQAEERGESFEMPVKKVSRGRPRKNPLPEEPQPQEIQAGAPDLTQGSAEASSREPEEGFSIESPEEGQTGRKLRPTMRYGAAARPAGGRSGFGTYAPTYRTQNDGDSRSDSRQDSRGGVQGSRFTSLPSYDRQQPAVRPSFNSSYANRSQTGRGEQPDDTASYDRQDSRGYGRGYDRQDSYGDRGNASYSRSDRDRGGYYSRGGDQGSGDGYTGRQYRSGGFDSRPSRGFDRDRDPQDDSYQRDRGIGRQDYPAGRQTAWGEDRQPPVHPQQPRQFTQQPVPAPAQDIFSGDPAVMDESLMSLSSGEEANGILEVMPEGFGFIRCENYMPGDNDVYVSPSQIHRFGLKTGDVLRGLTKIKTGTEKFPALLFIKEINEESPAAAMRRKPFEELTPAFPDERIKLETVPEERATRIMDLLSPIGKGQRGMIVSPPKAGKTTLIKKVAQAVVQNHPEINIIILLIDERPEEVTDIRESIEGPNVEVIYSTFDETPEHHKRVAEMVLGRAQRLVEHGRDVMILLDSITRLSRAYNLVVAPSGRTLSGGLDPTALYMPKKFFGAARKMREGGSLTILATALVETGSRMDDMIFEEFKGTGNMELVLDRKLSERRIFPAIDILKSGTRRDDLLLTQEEQDAVTNLRQLMNGRGGEEWVEKILDLMKHTDSNAEFCNLAKKMR